MSLPGQKWLSTQLSREIYSPHVYFTEVNIHIIEGSQQLLRKTLGIHNKEFGENIWEIKPVGFIINQHNSSRSTSSKNLSNSEYTKYGAAQANC